MRVAVWRTACVAVGPMESAVGSCVFAAESCVV